MKLSSKKKKLIFFSTVAILLVAVVAFAMRGKNKEEVKLDIKTDKAEIADVQVKVTEVGTVEPEVKVDVKSAVSGKVTAIAVREGDQVSKGQLLARVEPDLAQAQSLSETKNELRSAEIAYEEQRKNFEEDDKLFSQGLMAPKQHRDTKTSYLEARQNYEKAREKYNIVEKSGIPISQSPERFTGSNVLAPMSGVVLKEGVEIGETVTSGVSSFNAGTVLFTVADVSSMIIEVGVNEVDIGKIHTNQPVKVTLDACPKVVFAGKIARIAPAVRLDEKVRVFDIEVHLDAQGKELRSGMTANVEVTGEKKEKVLTVPVEAIFQRDEGEVVYLRKAVDPKMAKSEAKAKDKKKTEPGEKFDKDGWKKNFNRVTVVTGLSDNSRVEIVSGLKLGDEIALEDPTLPRDKKDEDED